MQSSDQGRRYPCDIHDIGKSLSELPFSVTVEDRGTQQIDLKYGDILTIYAIGDISGFVTQHEKAGTFLFIPGTYDGTFRRSSALFPQAEDLRESNITQYIKATKSWVSPYSNLDSVYFDDVMRIVDHGYITAVPHNGPEEEIEMMICELKTYCDDGKQKRVQIPLCAEGNFELIEEPSNIKLFKISELSNHTEYVEVKSRGSPAYVCQNESLIKAGRKMIIELEVSASAVLVWNERTKKLIEILSSDMLIVNLVSHNDRTDITRDGNMGVGNTIHILSPEKAESLKGLHPYADISDDMSPMLRHPARKPAPSPKLPPVNESVYEDTKTLPEKIIQSPPLKATNKEITTAKKTTGALPKQKPKKEKLKLFSLFK